MGSDELSELYRETDVNPPNRIRPGDSFWTVLTGATNGGTLLCINPATIGPESIGITDYPEMIFSHSVFLESGSFNDELTNVPVYVKLLSRANGYYEGTVLSESEWPDLEVDSGEPFTSNRTARIEWDGTPQRSNAAGADRRRELFSEGNVTGSKNDLL